MSAPKSNYSPSGRDRVGLAARVVAARLLAQVIGKKKPLDALCDPDTGLGAYRLLIAKDRALARAITTTALRRRGQIERILGFLFDRPPPANAHHLSYTLHVAAAQILFMSIPQSAAVNLAVTAISEDPRSRRFAGFANAVLRRLSAERDALIERCGTGSFIFPQWLAKAIRSDYGRQRADAIAEAILREPALDLTVHPAMADRSAIAQELDAVELATGSLRLLSQKPVPQLPGYGEGSWWVQDAASALPARLLGDVAGLEVADLCAAPGGKTAQLAAAGAHVTAVDLSSDRMRRLAENLARLRLTADCVTADLLEWQPGRRFDAVLLDAPCSSTGTLRRHPDVIWTKTPQDIAALSQLQWQLIARAAALVRPGGRLVYANCSILKQEGEDIHARMLREMPNLAIAPVQPGEIPGSDGMINGQGALRTLPTHLPNADPRLAGMDAFFACRFTVNES